jgi:site-specific recombinase XerD
MRYDAHDYKTRLEKVLAQIMADPSIPEKNKEAICRFQENCFIEGISTGRITRYLYDLRHISHWLGKNFEDVTKEDIRSLIGRIEKETFKKNGMDVPYQESTKRDFRITIKKFYRWLRETEDYPEEVKWIKSMGRKCERIKLPEEMLSEEDIKNLINVAENPRDKAFIAILYESGCRIGEMLFLRLKHIKFDQYGAQLLVDGKTGYRRIRIIASAPYLTEWINKHPKRDDPEAPLWITRDYEIMSYAALRITFKRIFKKAGVHKKINFHNFRHSRATYLANHLTEAQMKEFFGWVQASDMASIYVHLSGRDVDNALLKVYGIKKPEEQEESQLNPKKCPRCQEINQFTNVFCNRCGTMLDEDQYSHKIKNDLDRNRAETILNDVLADEDFKKLLIQKLQDANFQRWQTLKTES